MDSTSLAANSLTGILKWSTKLPLWQQDALRRIVEQGELADTDYDELADFCGREVGIPAADEGRSPVTLDSSAVASLSDPSQSVSLLQLSQVQHCNVICEKQTLTFGESGLTIIFGYNGSGKSGYGRVLRRACRSRHKDSTPILPNVLKPDPKKPASAEFTFAVDGEVQLPSQWIEGQKYDELLRNVSFFDSNCARVHVGQKNDIAFRPQSLCILETLAQALSKVKEKLDERKSRLTAQSLKFSPTNSPSKDSAVGKFISTLSVKSDASLLESLPQLSESQLRRLKAIPTELASDPVKQAKAKRGQASKVIQLQQITSGFYESLCETATASLRSEGQAWRDKQAAADVAASVTFEGEPIPHVGSATWRKLWEAAREFAKVDAYPADPFPKTTDDSNCVLCPQRLTDIAADRLARFESFVQDSTARDADAARLRLQSTVAHLEQCGRSVRDGHCRQLLRDFAEIAPDAVGIVRSTLAAMLRYFRVISRHCRQSEFFWADSRIEQLNPVYEAVGQSLENDAVRLEELADPEARIKLQAELAELQDRVWLGTVKADVQKELVRLILVAQLEAAGKSCSTNSITAYSKKVAREQLNDALRLAFANELRRLNEGVRTATATTSSHAPRI